MTNINSAMQGHIGNLQRAVGNDGSYGKYSYIISSNELLKSFYNSKKDLSYPLRKEVKRDRYIYNADGLQKDLVNLVNDVLQDVEKPFANMIASDIIAAVNTSVGAAAAKGTSSSSKAAALFSKAFAKGIFGGLTKIIDSMFDDDTL